MFKSTIISYINEFANEFCEDIDVSQLSVSLWSGDVILNEVRLRPTALESSAGLPISIAAGKIGKLCLKISWTSLFRSPVEVTLQNVYVLLVPSYGTYTQETEERISLMLKKNIVQRLEDRYKAYLLSQSPPHHSSSTSYTEHYGAQIGRNIELKVESIHIRYEDRVLRPSQPLSLGLVIKYLHVGTTDHAWKATYSTHNDETTYKLGKLEGFGIYWNRGGDFISAASAISIGPVARTLKEVFNPEWDPSTISYLIGPLTAEMRLILTPRPEKTEFQQPILGLTLTFNELNTEISTDQMRDLLHVAEILEFIARKQRYKKFKSSNLKAYRGSYCQWWKFAYNCILEDVRRRKSNWNWEHIKEHKDRVRSYMHVYSKKLASQKHPNRDVETALDELEKDLDVFNIIFARKLTTMHHTRLLKVVSAKKSAWSFGGWFGGGAGAPSTNDNSEALGSEWTSEEKAEINRSLDFDSHRPAIDYPTDYESYRVHCRIQEVSFVVTEVMDAISSQVVISLKANDFESNVALRPVQDGLLIQIVLGSVDLRGIKDKPHIISSKKQQLNSAAFEFTLENRPLYSSVGRRLRLVAHPLQLVYHYKTFQRILDLFMTKPEIEFRQLKTVTSKLVLDSESVMASNIRDLVKNEDELELSIDLFGPYILIPQGGALTRSANILVIDLGSLKMKSLSRAQSTSSTSLPAFTYEKYSLEFSDFQTFLALPGENYGERSLRRANYLVRYQQMSMTLKRSLTGPRKHRPGVVIVVHLPTLDVDISQHRFIQLIKLLITLPIASPTSTSSVLSSHSSATVTSKPTMSLTPDLTSLSEPEVRKSYQFAGLSVVTQAFLDMRVSTVKVALNQGTKKSLVLELTGAAVEVRVKNLSTEVGATVTGITLSLRGLEATSSVLVLLRTPHHPASQDQVASLAVLTVMPSCPRKYLPPVGTFVTLELTHIEVVCHREAMSTLINFILGFIHNQQLPLASSDLNIPAETSKRVSRARIKLKLLIKFRSVTIQLAQETRIFAILTASNLHFTLESTAFHDSIRVSVVNMAVSPVNFSSAFEKILLVEGTTAMDLIIIIYPTERIETMSMPNASPDLKIELLMGSPFVVLLPSFVQNFKTFLAHVLLHEDYPSAVFSGSERAASSTEQSRPLKLSLSIQVDSPRLALLEDDASQEAILVNLGNISIQNELKTTGGLLSVNEQTEFTLHGAKVSRIFIDLTKQAASSEVYLLNPLSLQFQLSRSLSMQHQSAPKLAMKIQVQDNVLHIDTRDYKICKKAFQDLFTSTEMEAQQQFVTGKEVAVGTGRHMNLHVELQFHKLAVVLYGRALSLARTAGVVARDETAKLAAFSLHKIQGNLTTWNNSDILASLVITEISIEDARSLRTQAQIILRRTNEQPPSQASLRRKEADNGHMLKILFKNGTIRNSQEHNVHIDLPALSVSTGSEFFVEIIKFFS